MKPFNYFAAASISEAVELLNQPGMVLKPLAGGTDLLVQLRNDLKEIDAVVDIKRITELNQIIYDDNGLTVGAAVSCARLCADESVKMHYPGLIDAAGIIGGSAIQERATIGGNLCNAAPSGDSIPAMIVLDAICTIVGPQGTKLIPVANICTHPGQTVLAKEDLLISIHFPPQPANAAAAYLRFTPRREMDIAVAGAGVWISLNENCREIIDARIALSAVAPRPLPVEQAALVMVGQPPDEQTIARAAEAAREAARPITDMRGTTAQRQHLVEVLVKRALQLAVHRATDKSQRRSQ